MARSNKKNKRPQCASKRPDKKQMRKKQAALVQRCLQELNSKADRFREGLSNPSVPADGKSSNEPLKHFKPIRIETMDSNVLSDAIELLDNKFSLTDSNTSQEKTDC